MFNEDRDRKKSSVVRKPPFASLPISFRIIEGLLFCYFLLCESKIKHSQNNLLYSLQLLNKRSGKKRPFLLQQSEGGAVPTCSKTV